MMKIKYDICEKLPKKKKSWILMVSSNSFVKPKLAGGKNKM